VDIQGYLWIQRVTCGYTGFRYTGLHVDTQGYLWIHVGTPGYMWIDTQGYGGLHVDAQITCGYKGLHTQVYTQDYTNVFEVLLHQDSIQ